MKTQNKGITLIALVITIIVLLILAGVSIVTLTGDNGLLTKANQAVEENVKGEERDQIALAYQAVKLDELADSDNDDDITVDKLKAALGKNGITQATVTAEADGSLTVEMPSGNKYKVTQAGVITNVEAGSVTPPVSITEYVKEGQYVDYEPTKTDVNKTQSVEAGKLTYTSPVGGYSSEEGIITHGNGYGEQTFTAKANDGTETGLKWRVLSVADDKIELISDTVITPNAKFKFLLEGGIGYLYAEQELNEVCKIYGYGYGADTSIGAQYTVGGPEDEPINGKIEGTGARSITLADLNKKAGIIEDETRGQVRDRNGSIIKSLYKSSTLPKTKICYPTLSSSDTSVPGRSTNLEAGFEDTSYEWEKSRITDTNIQNILFNNNIYYLASRSISPYANDSAIFMVRGVKKNNVSDIRLCECSNTSMSQESYYAFDIGVRPVVTLKPNVIDINTDYATEGEWKLK